MGDSDKNSNGLQLGVFLRESRMKAGLSQMQVAKKLGYTTAQFISNWERGVSEPPLKALKVLARIYSVSMDEIFQLILQSTIKKVTEDLKAKFKRTE